MISRFGLKTALSVVLVCSFALAGCGSSGSEPPQAASAGRTDVSLSASPGERCSGSEWADDSSIAYLPIPVVAFFVPHADLNEIDKERYLAKCGDRARLRNANVEVSHLACIPAGLTRIITLGVWQWCPAKVSWEADVR